MLNNYYKNKAKQLYEMGYKPYKIAWMLDMSYNQVYAYIRTLGHTQGKIHTQKKKKTLLFACGMTSTLPKTLRSR